MLVTLSFPEEDEGEASASRRLVASRDFDESAATAGKTNFYYRELQEQQEQSWRDRDERRRRRLHVVEQQKQQQRQPEYSLSTSVSSHLQAIRYMHQCEYFYGKCVCSSVIASLSQVSARAQPDLSLGPRVQAPAV